jgi:hypothetical protein
MSALELAYKKKKYNFLYRFFFINKNKVVPLVNEECNICFEDLYDERNFKYKCNHGNFCYNCICEWDKRMDNCPLCRASKN